MKTIKDILKADSYEQRRRIANNLAISREDKNALIVNKSNGGGDDSNGVTYYKVNLDNTGENYPLIRTITCVVSTEMKAIYGEAGQGYSNFLIGPAGSFIYNADGNFQPIAIGVASYIKIVGGILDDNDNITDKNSMIIEGTLKEVIGIMSEAFHLPFSAFDYLEPITEEEFYNIKPE